MWGRLKRWQRITLLGVAIPVALFALSYLFPARHEICTAGDYYHYEKCSRYHAGPYVIGLLLGVAQGYNGVITAIATAFIAWFTLTLRKSSDRLIDVSKQQTKLLNAQRLIEHRPHLRVRHVALGSRENPLTRLPGVGERVIGGVVVVNAGGTKAKIVDSRYLIHTQRSHDGMPMYSPMDQEWDTLLMPDTILDIGQSVAVGIKGIVTVDRPPGTFLTLGRNDWTVYVMGQIQFQDEGGNDRFMGFCRRWSGEGTFEPVPDQDYEYED
jgi:hypothetical protein